ncbi:uncharacterized protein BDV17DRAFT_293062 [Aspergillus undulatus]|uniref:uncharacterized protein n=1 Tax=Aspergillus undulatus TaxID=1810928 RepID=UPI003CCDC219
MHIINTLLFALSAVMASGHAVRCFTFKDMAMTHHIQEGVKYLRAGDIKSKAHLPADSCSCVSCSYGSAIYWCNTDKHHDKEIGFYNIAEGAQVLIDECNSNDGRYTGGIVDHPDHWQALIFRDEENC